MIAIGLAVLLLAGCAPATAGGTGGNAGAPYDHRDKGGGGGEGGGMM
jgi:hypothetical protein